MRHCVTSVLSFLQEMASDRAPLLFPLPADDGDEGVGRLSVRGSSPTDPATIGSGGGGDTAAGVNNNNSNSSRSGYKTRVERQNADDDELTDQEQDEQDEQDEEQQARDRDRDSDIQHSLPSSAASRAHRAPREASSCRRSKITALVVVAGVCLLVVGASFGAGARFGRAHPGRGQPSGVVEREGDAAAASLGDGLPLPQCYSTSAADPSVGAWRRCEGGAGECSPIGNATLPDWMPGTESRWVIPCARVLREQQGLCGTPKGTPVLPRSIWVASGEYAKCVHAEPNAPPFRQSREPTFSDALSRAT